MSVISVAPNHPLNKDRYPCDLESHLLSWAAELEACPGQVDRLKLVLAAFTN